MNHACALATDGKAVCWGDDTDGKATPPPGSFIQIEASAFNSCALTPDHTVQCWGRVGNKPSPTADRFEHIRSNLTGGMCGAAVPPAGNFIAFAVGSDTSCGVRPNGSLECWGTSLGNLPEGPFKSISGSAGTPFYGGPSINDEFCALRGDGTMACWGTSGIQDVDSAAPFTSASAAGGFACGLRLDGHALCWGADDAGQLAAPPGTFTMLSSSGAHSCGLRGDQSIECWGSGIY